MAAFFTHAIAATTFKPNYRGALFCRVLLAKPTLAFCAFSDTKSHFSPSFCIGYRAFVKSWKISVRLEYYWT